MKRKNEKELVFSKIEKKMVLNVESSSKIP